MTKDKLSLVEQLLNNGAKLCITLEELEAFHMYLMYCDAIVDLYKDQVSDYAYGQYVTLRQKLQRLDRIGEEVVKYKPGEN